MSLPTVCACISLALRVPRSLFLPEPSFYTGNCGYCVCMLQHVFCALMLNDPKAAEVDVKATQYKSKAFVTTDKKKGGKPE